MLNFLFFCVPRRFSHEVKCSNGFQGFSTMWNFQATRLKSIFNTKCTSDVLNVLKLYLVVDKVMLDDPETGIVYEKFSGRGGSLPCSLVLGLFFKLGIVEWVCVVQAAWNATWFQAIEATQLINFPRIDIVKLSRFPPPIKNKKPDTLKPFPRLQRSEAVLWIFV